MAQQFLHFAQSCAAIEHVGGKRMSESVRSHSIGDAQFFGIVLDDEPETLAGQLLTPRIQEQSLLGRSFGQQVAAGPVQVMPEWLCRHPDRGA